MLNRLRTAYVQLPGPARRAIAPVLSLVPLRYRYGKTYRQFRKHIAQAKSDATFVAEWQKVRLRALLQAATRTRHYSRIFRNLSLSQRDLANFTLGDLVHLPILTKDQVRNDPTAFLSVPTSELDAVSTGGSSGTPLIFYLDKDRSTKEWAFLLDAWSAIGFEAGMKRALLRGVQIDNVDAKPWEYEPALGELRLSPFHLTDKWMEKYCELILENRIRFLHGYPSALSIFSAFVIRRGHARISKQIDGVICASEPLFSLQRRIIEEAFDTRNVLSFYGLSEKVLFAAQLLDAPDQFVFDPLYGHLEIMDDNGGRVANPGSEGRVVGTGLLLSGMPFIRYDTGDRATLVEPSRHDNCYRQVVEKIAPRRAQEFLLGSSGELISMAAINIHSAAYSAIQGFQFFQNTPGQAVVRVIPAQGRSLADATSFLQEISQKVGRSIEFKLVEVTQLSQSSRGKIKFIDQQIDLPPVA